MGERAGGGWVRLGVTGHRTFADRDAVTALVDQVLDRIGGHGEVVSSLAEGADRLVAQRAHDRLGWALDVVLPLDPVDYAADFADIESRTEFADLLVAADHVEEVPPEPTRPLAYRAAGLRMLERCDAIIAIWDGEGARGAGGTAEIVGQARDLGYPVAWIRVERPDHPSAPVGNAAAPTLIEERWPWNS
jgi:hypothetical protein